MTHPPHRRPIGRYLLALAAAVGLLVVGWQALQIRRGATVADRLDYAIDPADRTVAADRLRTTLASAGGEPIAITGPHEVMRYRFQVPYLDDVQVIARMHGPANSGERMPVRVKVTYEYELVEPFWKEEAAAASLDSFKKRVSAAVDRSMGEVDHRRR